MILAHLAGFPVEEAFLSFASVGLGLLACSARAQLRRWWPARQISQSGDD
jgi:hypothetical protein